MLPIEGRMPSRSRCSVNRIEVYWESYLSWLSVVVSGFLVAVGRGFVLAGGTNWGSRRR
jgi:hypothetical protein